MVCTDGCPRLSSFYLFFFFVDIFKNDGTIKTVMLAKIAGCSVGLLVAVDSKQPLLVRFMISDICT